MKKKEEYQIASSFNENILEMTPTGAITENDFTQLVIDFLAMKKERNIDKVLIDISLLDGQLKLVDAYHRVRNHPIDFYRIKFAMVDNRGLNEYTRFHETTASNAGMLVKWFDNIDDARAWLKRK
jgi:hypothetical protein